MIRWIDWRVGLIALKTGEVRPVAFFNASTRIGAISLNSAFSLITSWAVRLSGVPIIHFVCNEGMQHCVLGTSRKNPNQEMPCRICMRVSRIQYGNKQTYRFRYEADQPLAVKLKNLPLDELCQYEQVMPADWRLHSQKIPLGMLVLPAIRWFLRRHNLVDDETTRYLYREFILSAWNVARQFHAFLGKVNPQLVVVFNGQFFPEAVVRWMAQQKGLRVITHEVGLHPLTGFFTDQEATIYPIHLPDDYDLGPIQNARLDTYLENRFKGVFSMAGIKFWPEMQRLDAKLLERISHFNQMVPVFTNVIFDTSQPHSNVVFKDMFDWLKTILEIANEYPATLFVLRAHPDESRPGKAARESVAMWVKERRATDLPNVMFVDSDEHISSYELIRRSKFVMVYSSTIGLEASILSVPVVAAGLSRYSDYPTVYFPHSPSDFRVLVEQLLKEKEIVFPDEHRRQARRFLYYHVFRASLPLPTI